MCACVRACRGAWRRAGQLPLGGSSGWELTGSQTAPSVGPVQDSNVELGMSLNGAALAPATAPGVVLVVLPTNVISSTHAANRLCRTLIVPWAHLPLLLLLSPRLCHLYECFGCVLQVRS